MNIYYYYTTRLGAYLIFLMQKELLKIKRKLVHSLIKEIQSIYNKALTIWATLENLVIDEELV